MKALITGAFGQDAQWLADLLLEKGYEVFVTDRRRSRQGEYLHGAKLIRMDLTDGESIRQAIMTVKPDDIYHLAAQSHVGWSFDIPEATLIANAMGTLHILETVRHHCPETRMYFAATSEMYGGIPRSEMHYHCKVHDMDIKEHRCGDEIDMMCPMEGFNEIAVDNPCSADDWEEINVPIPQNEKTPFHPQSPYAAAKLYAYWMVRIYREAYNLKVCSGILFNHESKHRGDEFLPKKVCKWIENFVGHMSSVGPGENMIEAIMREGEHPEDLKRALTSVGGPLEIGNIFAKRDWGWAKEYVEGMYRILHQDSYASANPADTEGLMPGKDFHDYVLGTGSTITVGEFVKLAFGYAGIDGEWIQNVRNIMPPDNKDWEFVVDGVAVVKINPEFYRPAEVHVLLADPRAAKHDLGWEASPNSIELIIKDMFGNA